MYQRKLKYQKRIEHLINRESNEKGRSKELYARYKRNLYRSSSSIASCPVNGLIANHESELDTNRSNDDSRAIGLVCYEGIGEEILSRNVNRKFGT